MPDKERIARHLVGYEFTRDTAGGEVAVDTIRPTIAGPLEAPGR